VGKIGIVPKGRDGVLAHEFICRHVQGLFQPHNVVGVEIHVCVMAAAGKTGNAAVAGKSERPASQKKTVADTVGSGNLLVHV